MKHNTNGYVRIVGVIIVIVIVAVLLWTFWWIPTDQSCDNRDSDNYIRVWEDGDYPGLYRIEYRDQHTGDIKEWAWNNKNWQRQRLYTLRDLGDINQKQLDCGLDQWNRQ